MELLGHIISFLLVAWLVLPLVLWLVQILLIFLVVCCGVADEVSRFSCYLVGMHKTRASFNGYIPKDRNSTNKISTRKETTTYR